MSKIEIVHEVSDDFLQRTSRINEVIDNLPIGQVMSILLSVITDVVESMPPEHRTSVIKGLNEYMDLLESRNSIKRTYN